MAKDSEKIVETYRIQDRVNYLYSACADINITRRDIKKILERDAECIEKLLLAGNDVKIGDVGTILFEYKKGRDAVERRVFGVDKILKRVPPTNIIKFKPTKPFRDKIQERYVDNAVLPIRIRNAKDKMEYYENLINGEDDG